MKKFDELMEIVEKLRNPKTGCPWDIKQTHHTLIPNFIEELYECVEAIESENFVDLSEELGDLMLHIVLQAQMAKEKGKFDIEEVLKKINTKLVRRHPHVFGNLEIDDSNKVKKNWELIKQEEKKHTRDSVLDGIPKSMPALIVAHRMQEKAASVGFDWNDMKPVIEKIREEINEFEEEMEDKNIEKMKDELGDILFAIVNLTRKLGIDSESSLRMTNDKFERRFKFIESYFKSKGINLKDTTLEQMDEVWNIAKQNEK